MSDLPKVSEQLEYLVSTDELYGFARGKIKALEHLLKVEKSVQFLEAEGPVAEREAKAMASDRYKALVDEFKQTVIDAETIGARRKTAELQIEVWRTQQANRRQGNIT